MEHAGSRGAALERNGASSGVRFGIAMELRRSTLASCVLR